MAAQVRDGTQQQFQTLVGHESPDEEQS
jgi:hypothetical protein